MARLNVYVPDYLAEAAREAGLNVSAITRTALERELGGRATTAWLATLPAVGELPSISADFMQSVFDAVKEEAGDFVDRD